MQTAAATAGAWWYDDNHTSPGAGWLQLPMLFWSTAKVDTLGRPGTIPVADMTDNVVKVRLKTKANHGNPGFYVPQETRLGWWMQTYDEAARGGRGGFVNMLQVAG